MLMVERLIDTNHINRVKKNRRKPLWPITQKRVKRESFKSWNKWEFF